MKKRVISLFLAVVMVVGMAMTAMAASVSASLDNTTIKAGEEVTVTINLDAPLENIVALEYWLFFDDSKLEFVSSKLGTSNPNVQISRLMTDKAGQFHLGKKYFTVNFVDPRSVGETFNAGSLYSLTFRAKESISSETKSTFRLYKLPMMDTTFQEIDEGKVPNGTIELTVNPTASEGYTVEVAPGSQTVAQGETANVAVNISAEGLTKYNAADFTFNYDASALTFSKEASTGLDGYTVSDKNGTLRLVAFGEDKALGQAFSLAFVSKKTGKTQVTLASAKLDDGKNADAQNAPEAAKGTSVANIDVSGYPVTLPEDFTGGATAVPGSDYTFTAKDKNYDYTFAGTTVNGAAAEVKDNGNGTFTISAVNGPVIVAASKTPKNFTAEVTGTGADDVKYEKKAAYLTDYKFTLNRNSNYTYDVSVTVGGKTYTNYTALEDVYTIPGADVTGNIAITVNKTIIPGSQYTVTAEGTGAGDVVYDPTALKGTDYSFTVNMAEGFDYDVTALVGGKAAELTGTNGKYTIPGSSVTGNIVIKVEKSEKVKVAVNEYVKLDGKTMFLVTATGTPGEGKTYAYDGTPMYYSDKYQGYCWLVISDVAFNETVASEKITKAAATAEKIKYDSDINGTGSVDVNDAQTTYNMYNAKYADFTTVTMDKFLKADVNGSKNLNVQDSAAIVNEIIG